MQSLTHANAPANASTGSSHAFHQSAVALPREHLAAIQHIINDALALQARAPRPPPPPYTHCNIPRRDSSHWFRPRMDVYQSASASGARPLVTATFELPGLRKEDVHIDVLDNHMIVAGDRTHLPRTVLAGHHAGREDEEMKDVEAPAATGTKDADVDADAEAVPGVSITQDLHPSREGYTVREIKRGRFKRVVPLPAGTKLEDMKASMHDGILTVTFPGSVRPVPRSIPVV